MSAVDNVPDDRMLDVFPLSLDEVLLRLRSATVTVSVASRAGSACAQIGKNCRTNSRFRFIHGTIVAFGGIAAVW
jgi:hypothetical protein